MLTPKPREPTGHEQVVLVAITDFERVPVKACLQRAERLASLARPGTLAVQLRDRTRATRELVRVGLELSRIVAGHGQLLVVNDRLDLARHLGVIGVHLGEGSVQTADARCWLPGVFVYRACHDPSFVDRVDADALLLSPILAARKGNRALGLLALSEARRRFAQASSATRLFALGGVQAASAADCLSAGADGVAAIGAAFDSEPVEPLLRALGILRE